MDAEPDIEAVGEDRAAQIGQDHHSGAVVSYFAAGRR
jgi:hypothetical protein